MRNLIVRFAAIGALLIGMSVSVFAQVPSKMNYQAVVRDSEGNLVTEKPIGVRVAIINSQRTEVFAETQVVETNVNGLLTIEIGEGDHLAGSLDDIRWASDSYSIVIGVDITGGVSYDIESVQPFMTVPYSFCAQTVESIDYSRVTNTPAIPSKVSDLTNDVEYVKSSDLGQYATKEDLSQIDLSAYAKIADLPIVPTKVSDLENDANYATKEELSQIDLSEYAKTADLPVVPTKVSDLTNDAEYITNDALANYATKEELSQIDLSEYAKQSDIPTVPTKVSDLENDANYATKEELSQIDLTGYAKTTDLPTKVSDLTNDAEYITNDALANYATKEELSQIDLSEYAKQSDIPTVPTKVSDLENDANYATKEELSQIDLTGYAKTTDIPTKVGDLENDANYATKEELAQIDLSAYAKTTDLPTKVSELTNDSEYITSEALANYATKEELPTVPTKVSELENDKSYLVADDLADYAKTADIPTKVSELENDENFVKELDLNGLVLDILYAAFKDPEVRNAIIEDILSDTESIKKYGSEIVDMVLADPEYVNTLGKKVVDYFMNDKEMTKEYVKKFIEIAKENKETIRSYFESLLANESFKAHVKQYAKTYLTESLINEFLTDFGKDKIVSIVKNLGVAEAIIADIDINDLIKDVDFTSLINTSELESTLSSSMNTKLQEAMASMLTYSAVSALSNVTVNGSAIKGGCASSVVEGSNGVIYSYGVCYGTTPYPSATDVYQEVGTAAGESTFTTPSLSAGTYYVRSYVASDKGMYYGAIQKVVIP